MAVLAPMPRAMMRMATQVNPGLLSKRLIANFRSCRNLDTTRPPHLWNGLHVNGHFGAHARDAVSMAFCLKLVWLVFGVENLCSGMDSNNAEVSA